MLNLNLEFRFTQLTQFKNDISLILQKSQYQLYLWCYKRKNIIVKLGKRERDNQKAFTLWRSKHSATLAWNRGQRKSFRTKRFFITFSTWANPEVKEEGLSENALMNPFYKDNFFNLKKKKVYFSQFTFLYKIYYIQITSIRSDKSIPKKKL